MLQAMPDTLQSRSVAAADQFYSRALDRIRLFMIALALPLIALCWWRFGWRAAAGFALGCLIGYVNFYWLKRVINAFVDRAAGGQASQSSGGVVFRLVFRYLLMALGAYVILTVSPASLNGLLAGFFLPVGAILCEAAFEVYTAIARGI